MQTLTIAFEPTNKRQKGRAFTVVKVADITANHLWFGGASETRTLRPVYLALGGNPTELGPFLANLRMGTPATLHDTTWSDSYGRKIVIRYELLVSGSYQIISQTLPDGGEVKVAFIPNLFQFDPGMIDPAGARFVAACPVWWAERERGALLADEARCAAIMRHMRALGVPSAPGSKSVPQYNAPPLVETVYPGGGAFTDDELLDLVPEAAYVVSYLEKRTRRPIPPDLAFFLQLYLAALESKLFTRTWRFGDTKPERLPRSDPWWWASHTTQFTATGLGAIGLCEPVACRASHNEIDAFLSEQVRRYTAVQRPATPRKRTRARAV